MLATLDKSEADQLLQTIEMFEVIAQTQPDDCQSLEILKDAYSKLGQDEKAYKASRQLGKAYVLLGQYSQAIMEFEGILEQHPDDEEIRKSLASIEAQYSKLDESRGASGQSNSENSKDVGRDALHDIYVGADILNPTDFDVYWSVIERGEESNNLVDYLDQRGIITIENSLKLISEKTGIGFLELDLYDVDVEFSRKFSRDTCLRWQVLPFDQMSRVAFVATTNPFNQIVASEIRAASGLRPVWYLAHPSEINNVLRKAFR